MEEKKYNSIGGLWRKKSKYGEFLTGSIEIEGKKINIILKENTKKKSEKSPDFFINENSYNKNSIQEVFPNSKVITQHSIDKGNAFSDKNSDSEIPF